jgi:hypothetical protein
VLAKPNRTAQSRALTLDDFDDERFEMELVGRYASFVAGTPFVLPPEDEDEEDGG